ncbi:MAG TPA: hypothetical protein VLQ45_16910 [Thermoanaerobaculia bacterium]|nr:hypothetical protein [Thermoanaerobaculia bacterium]
MSSPFLVPDGWTIDHWAPDTVPLPEGIPSDGVKQGGPLAITIETVLDAPSFSLGWLNQRGESCSVEGLEPDGTQRKLKGKNLTVFFGKKDTGEDDIVQCDVTVTLTLDSMGLVCRITLPELPMPGKVIVFDGPDVGSGTFTATANGGPGPVDTGY